MRLHPIIAGVVVVVLTACLLSVAWRYIQPGRSSSIPGVAIWFVSLSLGVWVYRYRARRQRPK